MSDEYVMLPRRPYLLRAHYDWLLDNGMTPHLLVNVLLSGVLVPMEYAQDGQILLNIAPRAVGNLQMSDDGVSFSARFGGVPRNIYVPMAAIMAIYARENGTGMMFEPEPAYEAEHGVNEATVKESVSLVYDEGADPEVSESTVEQSSDDEPPKPPRGRPMLRVVK